MSKNLKEKNQTQTWDFKLETIEKAVEKLILKYRDPSIPVGASMLTTILENDKLPDEGFFLVLLSKRKDKIALRQFGSNITSDTILQGFMTVLKNVYINTDDTKIGKA